MTVICVKVFLVNIFSNLKFIPNKTILIIIYTVDAIIGRSETYLFLSIEKIMSKDFLQPNFCQNDDEKAVLFFKDIREMKKIKKHSLFCT